MLTRRVPEVGDETDQNERKGNEIEPVRRVVLWVGSAHKITGSSPRDIRKVPNLSTNYEYKWGSRDRIKHTENEAVPV
jgi:hypothetical protein